MRIRPVIDIGRQINVGPARAGTFSGNTASEALIGAPGSPVAGPQFEANAGMGGTFYGGTGFPATYQGSYFWADYGRNWIKNMVFGANNRPVEVRHFADVETPVFVATHPSTGGLYYVNLIGNEVRRIDYAPDGNRPPVA